LSLRDGEDGRLLAFCHGGCTYDELLPTLIEAGLLDGDDAAPYDTQIYYLDRYHDDAARIAEACAIYGGGVWDERILVYLRSRLIDLFSPELRFSTAAPHRSGARLPAMLAPVVGIDGTQTGVHATFLRADGSAKATIPAGLQRETRGVIRGGTIRLTPFDPGVELLVGEGIESTLSAMQLFGLPGWAAISAAGLKSLDLPPEVRSVIIAADNDAGGAGQRAALGAYARWRAEGRQVAIKLPPIAGHDFNDVLRARRGG
jgi:hypothetical protein